MRYHDSSRFVSYEVEWVVLGQDQVGNLLCKRLQLAVHEAEC